MFTSDMAALKKAWSTQKNSRGVRQGLKMEWTRALQVASVKKKLPRPVAAMPSKQDLREARLEDAGRLAGYVTKDGARWSIAAELTRHDVKTGRKRSLAPLELLLAADGDRRKRALWQEYLRATKGVQRISYSAHHYVTDDGVRVHTSLVDHLAQAWRRHENRESWIEAGSGDDPRAVANRQALEAQEAALRALSPAERLERDRRDQLLGAEPPLEEVASFEHSEQLSGRDGHITLGRMHSQGLLFGLLNALEADDRNRTPRETAAAFIEGRGLPIDPARPRKRARRPADSRQSAYRESRAEFEARLATRDLDEAEEERLLDRFDAIFRPRTNGFGFRRYIQ